MSDTSGRGFSTGDPHLDHLGATAGRRRRNLFLSAMALDGVAVVLVVLGYTALDSMTLVWAGVGVLIASFVYLFVGMMMINRSTRTAADRLITPPGGNA